MQYMVQCTMQEYTLFIYIAGMYIEIEDTKSLWFNPQSFEADSQYKLIGMILGLAVYNSVILDVRFPQVTSLYWFLLFGNLSKIEFL